MINPLYANNQHSNDNTWDDIIQQVMAKNIDTSVGKIDFDYTNKGVKIADSTDIDTNSHKLHWAYQLNHAFKMDGKVNLHVHWIQSQSDIPNWWCRWRIWQNGEDAESWNSVKLATQVFTYSSGTILQVSYMATPIDLSSEISGGLNVSDFLDVEFTRDSDNSSGLFSGNDPVSGNVTIKGFDPHIEVDSCGSRTEWSK